MTSKKRLVPVLVLVAAIAAGCVRVSGVTPSHAAAKKPPAATESAAAAGSLVSALATRTIAQLGTPTLLTGKVKIVSDNGGGIVSDNGGGIVSDNGGGVISNNTGNIVSDNGGALTGKVKGADIIANNGGGLVGKTRLHLLQAAGPREYGLSDAVITVHDATGAQLVDEHGKPITATSDAQGNYQLSAVLPPGNLVLKIALATGNAIAGGELTAMLPHPGGPKVDQPIDTATSLGAAYVLGKYVKGNQKTFDKLPASEAAKLHDDLVAAQKLLAKAPSFQPDALAGVTEDLRAKAPAVSQELDTIKALLLGQANGGDGRQATATAIFHPMGLALHPSGALLVGEPEFGRVRAIAPDGTISTLVDVVRGKVKTDFPHLNDLVCGPDGTLYAAVTGQVIRVTPDGKTSSFGQDPTQPLDPGRLALAPDGTLYIGEDRNGPGEGVPRVLAVGPDGVPHALDIDKTWQGGVIKGMDVAADGTLYLDWVDYNHSDGGHLYRYKPGEGARTVGAPIGQDAAGGGVAVAPDGTVYVSQGSGHHVLAISPDGSSRVAAGAGGPAVTQDLDVPDDLLVTKDGTLLIADGAANLVRALGPDGSWTVRAGTTRTDLGTGDLGALALNAPMGAAFDDQNRLVVSERGSFQVQRFDGSTLTTIAGTVGGDGGDGGPATAARFGDLTGVATSKGEVYISDSANGRLRKVTADGTVVTVVGGHGDSGNSGLQPGVRLPKDQVWYTGSALALDANGLPYWIQGLRQICRLTADGNVELVAGTLSATGRGGPDLSTIASFLQPDGTAAIDAHLAFPKALAFDPKGDLYFSDIGLMQVRRISGLAGPAPTISTVVGVPAPQAVIQMPGQPTNEGLDATQAALAMPVGLCFDAKGTLYLGELGTVSLPLLTNLGGEKVPFADSLPPIYARISKIGPDGKIHVIAGPGSQFFKDPTAEDGLVLPLGLAASADGRLAIIDPGANLIRVLPAGSF